MINFHGDEKLLGGNIPLIKCAIEPTCYIISSRKDEDIYTLGAYALSTENCKVQTHF